MNKPIIIWQPGLIGDICFLQKMVEQIALMGHRVIFPLDSQYSWIRDLLIRHPNIEMPLITEDFDFRSEIITLNLPSKLSFQPIETNDFIFFSFYESWRFNPQRTMYMKYEMANMSYDNWQDYVHIKRNTEKENDLFYNVLNLNDTSDFTLLNETYSRGYMALTAPPPVVKMSVIPGYTLFDWSKVIEKATRIVTVDTSLVLLAEILKTSAKLHVVSRYNPPDFSPIDALLKLKWQYALTPKELDFSK